jgi:hypothetical protein
MKRYIEDFIIDTEMDVLEHEIKDFLRENNEKGGENER